MTSQSYTRARDVRKGDPAWRPGAFVVFVWVDMRDGKEPEPWRIGGYRSLADAKKAIDDDRAHFKRHDPTFGGLINWPRSGPRHYRIFQCDGWTEVA